MEKDRLSPCDKEHSFERGDGFEKDFPKKKKTKICETFSQPEEGGKKENPVKIIIGGKKGKKGNRQTSATRKGGKAQGSGGGVVSILVPVEEKGESLPEESSILWGKRETREQFRITSRGVKDELAVKRGGGILSVVNANQAVPRSQQANVGNDQCQHKNNKNKKGHNGRGGKNSRLKRAVNEKCREISLAGEKKKSIPDDWRGNASRIQKKLRK